jgi:hypothetical protein
MARSGWPDLVFSNGARREILSRAVTAGRLRRIDRGIYTPSADPLEVVTRRHLEEIVAHEFPGAVIVDRSARTELAGAGGDLYVDHRRDRPLELPGVVIRPRPGPGPLPGDIALPGGIHLSSPARGLIDNLAGRGRRFLSRQEVEAWIAELRLSDDPGRLDKTMGLARDIARQTDRMPVFERLSRIVAAALPTGRADAGTAGVPVMDPVAAAEPDDAGVGVPVMDPAVADAGPVLVRVEIPLMDPGGVAEPAAPRVSVGAAAGPCDPERIATLEAAANFLAHRPKAARFQDPPEAAKPCLLLPFYEAHFSSCIEGRQFTLNRAAAIVFDKMVPMDRPGDARDLLGTYRIVSRPDEMSLVSGSAAEFVELLRRRHRMMMAGRPGKCPGEFRNATAGDNAGSVSSELVEGTLRAGFEIGQGLREPFARAVFMMFLVSEVCPFTAGNGCLARVMMNAELVGADEVRIVIPMVIRGEYLSAVKTASTQRSFDAMYSLLDYARWWTAEVDFSSWASAERDAIRTNALVGRIGSGGAGIGLILPSAFSPVAG